MTLGMLLYALIVVLMMLGLYTLIASQNLLKKLAGLSLLQTAVFLLYVAMGYVQDGTAPIVAEGFSTYANPLPQVLMLTAIVVGIATAAQGFALIVRIHHAFGSLEEDELGSQIE